MDFSMETLKLIITIVQLLLAVGLICIVLFQSGKSSGLSGAIAGASDSFMSKTRGKSADAMLAKATKWVAIAFAVLTLVLNIL